MPDKDEQVKKWEEKWGKLLELSLQKGDEQVVIYLKKPEKLDSYFGTMSRAISAQERDNTIEAGEIILRACYLGGAFGEELQKYNKDTPEFLSACFYCSQLITVFKGNFRTT